MLAELHLSSQPILDAAQRIGGYIKETPLLENPELNAKIGCRVLVKAESLQVTGSFKARGAFHNLLSCSSFEVRAGVVAFSSGNHAQAVAYAAKTLGISSTILMPEDAPALKLANTRAYGANVVLYNRYTESREALGQQLAKQSGLKLIHPYDDWLTITGQGTVGLELVKQCNELAARPDAVVIPCSGGGLSSGVGSAVRGFFNHPVQIYTVEPEYYNDAQLSLASGRIVKNPAAKPSKCDALMAPELGRKPFSLLRRLRAKGLMATPREVEIAMYSAHQYFGLKLEPSGAVALGAVLSEHKSFAGQTIVVVASGSNVDSETYTAMVERGRAFAS